IGNESNGKASSGNGYHTKDYNVHCNNSHRVVFEVHLTKRML
ncbi:hypothetical protein CPC698_0629B, partial [Chlamydia psittaci C6/98]